MQEEVEQKTFNIVVSTTKLTARTILNAGRTALQQYQSKLLADKSSGKQSVRMLLRQNRGVSSVEIDKTNIRGFERYAKKYGIDYAIRKDNSEVPPRYLVFFKAPDAEAFHAAFKEYSASLLNKTKRPSVLAKLHELVQTAAEFPGKVRRKEQERGL
ncbi:PcfB family protein [Phascolarctobacterium succinatutens]|uniref:PcfB family protein n=1 Tax=Phascolarctobacterium succinatutens TaxID=626940 RepID=UPI0040280654